MVAEMEGLHGMKRKQLQALCKKHGVPANLTNRQMADKLSLLLKVPLIKFSFTRVVHLTFSYCLVTEKIEAKYRKIEMMALYVVVWFSEIGES